MNNEQLIKWRRYLHQYPELGFAVEHTADFIAEKLRSFGLNVHTGIGQTGVVGVLTKGTSKKAIGLRADMDALKIQELNTFEYRSRNAGQMHACGHDGHSVMLLGAAYELANSDDNAFDGTVYFIFQPNEEHGLGAKAMIEDGLFRHFNMHSIFGMHNMPGLPKGSFAVKSGAIMAGEDNFTIHIQGRGGHASQPHHHIDPVIIAAEIIQALQTIVARNVNPVQQAVVSVTEIETNGTVNVIPSNVILKGDSRSFDPAVSQTIEQRMKVLSEGICNAHHATLEFSYQRLFPPTINHKDATENALKAVRATVNDNQIIYPCDAYTTSEDFASMLMEKPGCYLLIGNGEDSVGGCMLHNPHYDFNDDILPIGTGYWINLVKQQLA